MAHVLARLAKILGPVAGFLAVVFTGDLHWLLVGFVVGFIGAGVTEHTY